jgi:hypothetical protein
MSCAFQSGCQWRGVADVQRSIKPHTAVAFLVVLGLVAGCVTRRSETATHRDYVTDLDFTAPTGFDATTFAGDKPLRQFGTNNVAGFSDNYIFGVYRSPMDLAGGHYFHVFPDGSFAIEAFCDIALPQSLALGRWKLAGNELVVSDLIERTNASMLPGMRRVSEGFGAVEKLRVFVTGQGEQIGDTILVSEETVRAGPHVGWRYIQRIKYYRDWAKEQKRLSGK